MLFRIRQRCACVSQVLHRGWRIKSTWDISSNLNDTGSRDGAGKGERSIGHPSTDQFRHPIFKCADEVVGKLFVDVGSSLSEYAFTAQAQQPEELEESPNFHVL